MPNVRLSMVFWRFCWVACHCVSRDSRGWADVNCGLEDSVCWDNRKVSGRPGTDGAPRAMDVVGVNFEVCVLVVVVG